MKHETSRLLALIKEWEKWMETVPEVIETTDWEFGVMDIEYIDVGEYEAWIDKAPPRLAELE